MTRSPGGSPHLIDNEVAMQKRLLAAAALVAVLAACRGDPVAVRSLTSTDDPVLAYPRVVASAADVLSIRNLTDDEFLRELVEHVADQDIARQLRRGLTELSAAAGTTNGNAVMRKLVVVRAEDIWQGADEFDPDDELVLRVFEIMLDHAEWVLTTPAETTEPPDETTSIERANSSISN